MDTTEHIAQEKEKENDSIKQNLQKSFFTFRDERAILLDKQEAAKKAKNLLRFGNKEAAQLIQATEDKKRLEKDLSTLEEQFQIDFRGFLEEFSKQTAKWIILIYNDKLDNFMKQFILDLSKELDLQTREEKMRLFIARKGKSIQELIEITKKEQDNANKAKKDKERIIPEQQTEEKKPQEAPEKKVNQAIEDELKERQEAKKKRQAEINEYFNSQSNKTTEQTAAQTTPAAPAASSIQQKQPDVIKPDQVAKPIESKSQQTSQEAKKQTEKSQSEQTQSQSGKQTSNKTDANKDTQRTNNKKQGQSENKDDKNNKKVQENDPKKKQQQQQQPKEEKKPEEEVRIEDLIKQPFKTESQRVEELLKETAEEQKAMNEDDIIQMMRTAADSVNEYSTVSMDENYNLHIRVVEPDCNSFPICKYELYLVREHSYKDLMEIAMSDQQALDKILLAESETSDITLDLIKALKLDQECKYIQKVNRDTSVLFFAVIALTEDKQSDEHEIFTSKIQTIFRINIPHIIPGKTSFLMAGSLNLISKEFFQDPDGFEGNLTANSQALKMFLPLDSSNVFSLCQPQAVSIRRSVLLLLKSGQVLQWGDVVAFQEDKKEYILSEDDELMLSLLTYAPFCPVDHPLVFTKIAQGDHHYAGVSIDGQVYTWGLNVFGELGHSNYVCLPEPKRVMYFSENNIFIVDVKCGEHFTVCLSVDGKLYTFGSSQAPDGQEIKDNYGDVLNYENKGISQPVPRQVDCQEVVTEFSCGDDHCIFLTRQGSCYIWGDNSSQQIISNGHLQFFSNFVHPVKVVPANENSFIFKLVACSNQQNYAVLKHIVTGEEICVAWGGKQNEWLDLRKNKRFFAKITDFHEIVVREDSLMAINSVGQIYASGSNFEYKLGIPKQLDEAQVSLPPQSIVHSAEISTLNSSGIIISKK